jgi:hypothetical protein
MSVTDFVPICKRPHPIIELEDWGKIVGALGLSVE